MTIFVAISQKGCGGPPGRVSHPVWRERSHFAASFLPLFGHIWGTGSYICTVNVCHWKKLDPYRVFRLDVPGSSFEAGGGGM
ncbi:MAG: hypothetical protein K6T80_02935 [Firmicutes bacterium]|nr:hypothetical protein [Bacillota bacterium]